MLKMISYHQKKVRFSDHVTIQVIENLVEKNQMEFQEQIRKEKIKGQLHIPKVVSSKKLNCLG